MPGPPGITGPKGDKGSSFVGLRAFGYAYDNRSIRQLLFKEDPVPVPMPRGEIFYNTERLTDSLFAIKMDGIYEVDYSVIFHSSHDFTVTLVIRKNRIVTEETMLTRKHTGGGETAVRHTAFLQLNQGDMIELYLCADQDAEIHMIKGCSVSLRLKKIDYESPE